MVIMEETNQPLVFGNDLYSVQLNDGLSAKEIEEATAILRWLIHRGQFFGVAGVMLVTGEPRSGKDTFANVFAWKCKRYFKGVRVVRDDHPNPVFGGYTYWDNDMLINDLEQMKKMAKDKETTEKLTDAWLEEQGKIKIQNAAVLFTEAWQKMSNRNPMSVENRILGGLNKMWGHTETLFIYIAQWAHDLDRFTCLPWVNIEVRCKMSTSVPNTVEAHLYHVKWSHSRQRLELLDKAPVRISIDAAMERPELGISHIDDDGTIHYHKNWDLFNSKSKPNLKFNYKKLEM